MDVGGPAMTTYIPFDTPEESKRFREECFRLGYPSNGGWPSSRGNWDDPDVPKGISQELVHQAIQYAKLGIRPSDLEDQDPAFRYLRVKRRSNI
jgi:hypothetical protein